RLCAKGLQLASPGCGRMRRHKEVNIPLPVERSKQDDTARAVRWFDHQTCGGRSNQRTASKLIKQRDVSLVPNNSLRGLQHPSHAELRFDNGQRWILLPEPAPVLLAVFRESSALLQPCDTFEVREPDFPLLRGDWHMFVEVSRAGLPRCRALPAFQEPKQDIGSVILGARHGLEAHVFTQLPTGPQP